MMVANARMYAVSPRAAAAWRSLLSSVAARAGVALNVIDHPKTLPISELWDRTDKAAVFMCGLPYSRARPRPQLLAVPVPAGTDRSGMPQYWSEWVVAADSPYETLAATLGHGRIAFTTSESQSGFAAPLRFLAQLADQQALPFPFFREVIAPTITPRATVEAVAEHRADIAPVDAYALQLLRAFDPQLSACVRTVARTADRPMPPLVGEPSAELSALRASLLHAHEVPELRRLLEPLLLSGFVAATEAAYDVLQSELIAALEYWRSHALADRIDPGFVPYLMRTS